jgi:hypothetical protein
VKGDLPSSERWGSSGAGCLVSLTDLSRDETRDDNLDFLATGSPLADEPCILNYKNNNTISFSSAMETTQDASTSVCDDGGGQTGQRVETRDR